MLKPALVHHSTPITALFSFSKPFLHGNNRGFHQIRSSSSHKKGPKDRAGSATVVNSLKAVATSKRTLMDNVTAVITVKSNSILTDEIAESLLFRKNFRLELVSTELDRKTGSEKTTKPSLAITVGKDKEGNYLYESKFNVPFDFGEVGAVYVENEHRIEMYLKKIVLKSLFQNDDHGVRITCNSWLQPKDNTPKRNFFADKSYLPSATPDGLKRLRGEELQHMQGDGHGVRQPSDRKYDYDVYNDLENPDKDPKLKRPVLGGKEYPYPRRCRTGRPRSELGDEIRADDIYVPRDEAFSDIKQDAFDSKKKYSFISTLPTLIETKFDGDKKFEYFTEIDELFDEDGFSIPPNLNESIWNIIPRWIRKIKETGEQYLQFETPEALHRDKFFWFRDEEFARQTLAGLNPCSIQLLTELPQESSITKEIIEKEIGGNITVAQAIQQKKLFSLDYHDLLLPFVEKVRHIEDEDEDEAVKTTLYGSRTIFFLNPDDTLRPLAIELTRPPMDGKPLWRKVYTPSWNSTDSWLWRLAKTHVLAHDAGYHQLSSHWLTTHCVVEPYVIATNRQLSVIHPIYRLLHPHFRYTMEINAFARKDLVNAGGIIESTFSLGKYSMELTSVAYDKQWRFDHEALPKNLFSRGMAVEDPSSPHGLKLTIEDYPYAKDGLDLWDILKKWVTDYVNHYYTNQSLVETDEELQAWWTEIRTVGHGDKNDEPWWPVLKTPQDLIEIITTIIWVTSGQHAAVNFGQYTYAGYFPNRPTIARVNMPDEDKSNEIWKIFNEKPDNALLYTFPDPKQATDFMLTLNVLSCHSPNEEFLGKVMEPAWGEDPEIKVAFEKFSGRLMELEGTINERNGDINLKNRNGAGIVPYNLLKPYWKDGDKEKGVPYSISI